jgi:hypothetical protein
MPQDMVNMSLKTRIDPVILQCVSALEESRKKLGTEYQECVVKMRNPNNFEDIKDRFNIIGNRLHVINSGKQDK